MDTSKIKKLCEIIMSSYPLVKYGHNYCPFCYGLGQAYDNIAIIAHDKDCIYVRADEILNELKKNLKKDGKNEILYNL